MDPKCDFGPHSRRVDKMSGKDNNFDFLSLLAGIQKPVAPNPFARVNLPPPPSASLAGLARVLSRPVRPQPPALSVEHMKGILEESVSKKPDVNPGRQLPTVFDLAIGEGRELNATFVYTDLDGYSKLISTKGTGIGFQLLQGFVSLVEKITGHFNGAVVDCAGDRTLSVFFRPSTDRSAAPIKEALTAALWIQTAIHKVIAPRFAAAQVDQVRASIGVDYGKAIAGCVGVRGNKRLIFFGDAANNAAKLQDLAAGGETVVSPVVFQYKPGYLNGPTWHFEPTYSQYQWTITHYTTNHIFSDDIPVGPDTYLK